MKVSNNTSITFIYIYLFMYILEAYGLTNTMVARLFLLGILLLLGMNSILYDLIFKKMIKKKNLFFISIIIYLSFSTSLFMTLTESILVTLFYPSIIFLSLSYDKFNKKHFDIQNIIFISIFIILYFYTRLILGINHGLVINSCYYLLLMLPNILLQKNKNLKNILLVLVLIVILFSMKRTALMAYIISMMIYLSIKFIKNKNISKKTVLLVPISSAILFLGIIILNRVVTNLFNNNIFNRFGTLNDTRGSLISTLLDILYTNTPIINWIFGRGYNSTELYLNGLTSHNDFIEILFNFGIVGLIMYLFVYSILIKNYVKMKRIKEISVSYLISIIIFFVVSLFSHLIFIPSYFALLIVYWQVIRFYLEGKALK